MTLALDPLLLDVDLEAVLIVVLKVGHRFYHPRYLIFVQPLLLILAARGAVELVATLQRPGRIVDRIDP